jgi:hypothetical protein
MNRKINPQGLLGLAFVFSMIFTSLIALVWLDLAAILTYSLIAILPYSFLVIYITHYLEEVQQRLTQGAYRSPKELENDKRLAFSLWRTLVGLHISFGLLLVGLWLPLVIKLDIEQTHGLLAGYFTVSIAAGMAAPYLIWLGQ